MTNLTQKFGSFEEQLSEQHNALMARLGETNAKLDALITAMGGAPPTATVTLADVLDKLQSIFETLTDVHTDTISIDQKLLVARDTLTDIHADTISMDQKLLRIRNAISPLEETLPAEEHSSITWSLYRIMNAISPDWPGQPYTPVKIVLNQIYDAMGDMQSNSNTLVTLLGTPIPGGDFTFLALLQRIAARTGGAWESLGVLSSPAAGTALQLLACICDAEQKQLPTNPLDETNPLSCPEPFVSSGLWLGPFGSLWSGNDVIVATWSTPLPDNLSFGSVFGISTDYTELQCSDWSQWSVFVQSESDQYQDTPTSLTRYPTNEWRELSGSGSKAFSVSANASIKVYLCSHAQTSCMRIDEQPDNTWTDTGHHVFNPSSGTIWGGSGTNRVKVGFNANATGGATVEVRCNGTVIDTVQLDGNYTLRVYSVGAGAVLDYNIINTNSYVDWYPFALILS